MRKLSVAGMVALGALLAGPVMAADVDLRPALSKGPLPIAHVYNWTGCYIGVQGGGGFMHDSFVDSVDDSIFHGGGAIAGGQAGCNYQVQQFVVGVEGEGWWSGLKNKGTNNSTTTTIEGLETATDTRTSFVQTQNRWDAAVSLRAGYALDRLLFFGKAGVVFGGFRFSDAFTDTLVLSDALGSFSQSETGSKTLTGMLLGFGLEWAFLDNWLLRFEADYLNFPRTDVPFASSTVCTTVGNLHCGLTTVSQTSTFSEFASKGLLKVGVSYKFY